MIKIFMQSMNKYGDSESPCLNPLEGWNHHWVDVLFTFRKYEKFVTHSLIKRIQVGGKPNQLGLSKESLIQFDHKLFPYIVLSTPARFILRLLESV